MIVPVAAAAESEQDVTSASAFITAHDDRGGEHQEQRQDAITSATIMHSPSAVQDNDNDDDDDKIVLFSSGPLSSAFPTANEPVVSVS